MSAAYDYSTWNLLRLIYLDLVSFDFVCPRGNATGAPFDRHCLAHCNSAFVFACDPDSFTDSAPTYRRTFQKFESALDRAGCNGRSRLGDRD
jgi:hypothetical protein